MVVLHIKQLLYCWRFALFELELHERSDWRTTAPESSTELQLQTCVSHSLIEHCVRTQQVHTYIAIWYATTHDNKTQIAYDCTTHQTTPLLPTMHHFASTNLATYSIQVAVSFNYRLTLIHVV